MYKISSEWLICLGKIINECLNRNYIPLPISKSYCFEYFKKLNISKNGKIVIYTSCMYQLAPIISKFVDFILSLIHI